VPESGFFAIALEKVTQNIFVKKWERLNPSDRPLHLLYGATSLTMRIGQLLCAFILSIVPITAPGQQTDAPQPQRGSIRGTVTDVDAAAIPGATLAVDGPAGSEHRCHAALKSRNDERLFSTDFRPLTTRHLHLKPGTLQLKAGQSSG
jgi:hypothetical protein